MTKLNLENVNFEEKDYVVGIKQEEESALVSNEASKNNIEEIEAVQEAKTKASLILNQAHAKADEIVNSAMQEIEAKTAELEEQKTNIIEQAKKEAQVIADVAKEEIEQLKIKATREGYDEGHREGLEKVQEELEEKINAFSKFCEEKVKIKDKVLKSASRDILNIISNLSKKILLKEIDKESLEKIIRKTISLLEKKENITIILSEEYARMLFELQKKSLFDDVEFKFEDFKQYDGFSIVYNSKFPSDTIIIENLKERYDASVSSQLEIVLRDIYNNSNNGNIELEQYIEEQ